MDVISLYEDAARDLAAKDENGYLSYEMFNRMLRRASLRLLNYLTGDQSGQTLPIAYSTEKAKGFIAFLITPYKQQIVDGLMAKPSDYYLYENLYTMALKETGCEDSTSCDTPDETQTIIYTPVEVLDGQQFTTRQKTYIKLLKPSAQKPIAKEVGNDFEFDPTDLGNAKLEYVRYPIHGTINTVFDPTYNDDIADPNTSIDTEWGEWSRELLVYFIGDSFANHTRESALKQENIVTQQLPGGR